MSIRIKVVIEKECSNCKKYKDICVFMKKDKELKTCPRCLEIRNKSVIKTKCPHGRRKNRCKVCGGVSICEHNRVRSYCKDCGGSQI